eukprot:scaffold503_cov375-Pinguiococcus_pyrenoidosus.AAC.16
MRAAKALKPVVLLRRHRLQHLQLLREGALAHGGHCILLISRALGHAPFECSAKEERREIGNAAGGHGDRRNFEL